MDQPFPALSAQSTTSTPYQDRYMTSTPYVSRSATTRVGTSRPPTAAGRRSRAASSIGGEYQKIICAVTEARGVTPTVGLAFVNVSTGEAVISQICDSQFYARTLHKIEVFEPSQIIIASTAGLSNAKSKLYGIIEENIHGIPISLANRKYWSEEAGLEYIDRFAFAEDAEAIKQSIGGNYFATCCFAAALKHIECTMHLSFASNSLRIKYQPSEGTMMIDLATIRSLELVQNSQNAKSRECLFGLMNQTLTPMGCRLLRSCLLQPTTQLDVLMGRYEAVTEMCTKEEMFFQTRHALQHMLDIEKLLSSLIVIPTEATMEYSEQSINQVLMLKTVLKSTLSVFDALQNADCSLLREIRENCRPVCINSSLRYIEEAINDDVTYQKTPLDLRNQRTYAVKSGVNGLLDVARQAFKEATEDVHQHISDINQQFEIQSETKYDNGRRYFLRMPEGDFIGREVPDILINRFKKKGYIECQTLELVKLNQKIEDSHLETILMSDKTVQLLLDNIRTGISSLYKICESVALLDMIAGFAQLATTGDEYTRPEISECIAVKSGRHPIKEKQKEKFIPNDVFASKAKRFQIITGCNMSGKSTYLRSVALMVVMAQVGSFVPASYASFPLIHQLFARVSLDDCLEANMSTFAAEMRETAFILRNIDCRSLAIIDELGRGTSTRDGLAIALSIAEALVDSQAVVFFATHFPQILNEREGVVNMHLTVRVNDSSMTMLYRLGNGYVQEEHYGLALAKIMNLPPKVIEVAETVSRTLEDQIAANKQSSRALAISKRRKLLLELKGQLEDLVKGGLNEKALKDYLKKLQDEFVSRMEAIDRDADMDANMDCDIDASEDASMSVTGGSDDDAQGDDESLESSL